LASTPVQWKWGIEVDNCCDAEQCSTNDLTGEKAAWLLWYLPIGLLFVGLGWERGRIWLWVPALVVMGVACLVNAARCRRMHCYFTGPLYIFAAVYVVLSALGVVPLHPRWFLLIVLGASCLVQCLELPLGKYRK
jgi:hypothetical protein